MENFDRRKFLQSIGTAVVVPTGAQGMPTGFEDSQGFAFDVISQSNVPIYSTHIGMPSINVPTGISALRVNGYAAAGDGGAALYVKADIEPVHGGKFQTADGAWWEIARGQRITPQIFGAVGNGTTDDTAAWNAFQSANGVKSVTTGSYLVDGEVKTFANDAIGDGNVTTDLTGGQQSKISVGVNRIKNSDAKLTIAATHNDANIQPAIYVSSKIDDNSGASFATKVSGIYSYMEQTGGNTNQYLKSICGVSVNAASGNNDSTGIVGYSYKLDVKGGIGDTAGAGGAAWQYSTEEGLVLGAEFSAHQNVPGTHASNFAKSGNNTMSLHVTTNSTGARCFAGIALDTFGADSGKFGFWNSILISRSCFMEEGAGEGVVGTVGINFGNNTIAWPEKAVYLGNANYHYWRAGTTAIRSHCSSLDIENKDGGSVGVRLVTPSASPQNMMFGGYTGTTGPDGTTSLSAVGGLTIDNAGYTYLTSYRGSAGVYTRVGCSPTVDAFIPLSDAGSGVTSLGASSRLWSQVYANSGTINTSDERCKADIAEFPNEVLDAWGNVNFAQFRFIDAIEKKGADARLHSGVVAQRVVEAFAAAGLDAARYGLLCYDEWDAIPDVEHVDRVLVKPQVDDEAGNILEPAEYEEIRIVTRGVAVGNRYGIRYEEALCLEAAYQRRRADRMEARLAVLEAAIAAL